MAETTDREDWKLKFRDLLTEIEHEEGDWQALDGALRGVASRLAITAMGRDARVDKHLTTILDAIKGFEPETRLLAELDGLSAAVLLHENKIAANEALDLSRFVASLQLAPATQKRFIDALESDTATKRMQALSELAKELNSLLQVPTETSSDSDSTQAVQKVLSTMVRHMDSVPQLEAAVFDLKQRLHDGIEQDALNSLLENLAVAVSCVIFKQVNDNFGHQTGDRLLAIVADMLSESTRVEDFVARIGGEEFVVLFPATDAESAHVFAERLREKVAAVSFHFKGTPIPVTVSCGITEFRSGDTSQAVYERADKALYQAKAEGRNKSVLA